jgi:large subunit ribosomal protein L9
MANVKLLLNETIRNVGKVGDVVEVSPGYARNYLIPKHLAVEPTPNNIKKIEARRKEIERIESEKRAGHVKLLESLKGVEVTLERKTNEQGHLYGAVSATDIAKALQAQGHQVEAEDVLLPGRMDQVNTYSVVVRFADDLKTDMKVWVSPDADSKAAIDAARKANPEVPPASNFEKNA